MSDPIGGNWWNIIPESLRELRQFSLIPLIGLLIIVAIVAKILVEFVYEHKDKMLSAIQAQDYNRLLRIINGGTFGLNIFQKSFFDAESQGQ